MKFALKLEKNSWNFRSLFVITVELNCFIFDLVSSFIQNTNKEFLKVVIWNIFVCYNHEILLIKDAKPNQELDVVCYNREFVINIKITITIFRSKGIYIRAVTFISILCAKMSSVYKP